MKPATNLRSIFSGKYSNNIHAYMYTKFNSELFIQKEEKKIIKFIVSQSKKMFYMISVYRISNEMIVLYLVSYVLQWLVFDE